MNGAWRRLGRLSLDCSTAPWASSHAALPVAEAIDDGVWRVYVSARDAAGRARIGRCTLRMSPQPILSALDPQPVLDVGNLGTFDDSGVTSSALLVDGNRRLLYYTGWSLGVTVPFYLAAGLAVSEDGGQTFQRVSRAPLLDRCAIDPYLSASPFVLVENGTWRMWYVSGTDWRLVDGQPRHWYHVRYAESRDGAAWVRQGTVCVDYSNSDEHAISRPFVARVDGGYRMWFASRGARYEIASAISANGISWTRCPEGGLSPARSGWDSEMVAYPWLFEWRGDRYLLYNGNDYGRTGIGLAVWEAREC